MQNILVTGGAGFVGSCLAMGLKAWGPSARVVALDNLKRRGSELNLPRLRAAGVEFLHGDIRNPEDLEAAGAFDLMIECSAEPSVLAGYGGSPRYIVNTNLTGTGNCLEAARMSGAALIFLSTSRVYPYTTLNALAYEETATRFELGSAQKVPGAGVRGISEDFPVDGPRSLYGTTKLCSEMLVQEYLAMYGLKGIINRCGVIAGPWQMGKIDQGVAVLWMARHVFGGSLEYIGFGGAGKQVRDLLHVEDLLGLILFEIEHLDALSGRVFNVGGGMANAVSLQELTNLCQEIAGRSIPMGSTPEDRPADVRFYATDCTRVTETTGWRPQRSARRILEDVHAWIQDHREALRPILG